MSKMFKMANAAGAFGATGASDRRSQNTHLGALAVLSLTPQGLSKNRVCAICLREIVAGQGYRVGEGGTKHTTCVKQKEAEEAANAAGATQGEPAVPGAGIRS